MGTGDSRSLIPVTLADQQPHEPAAQPVYEPPVTGQVTPRWANISAMLPARKHEATQVLMGPGHWIYGVKTGKRRKALQQQLTQSSTATAVV